MAPDSASVLFGEKKPIPIFHLEMELGSTCKGGGIPLNGKKKGKILTQFLEVFNLRWFGMGLSLDKKEGNAEIEKITLKRFWECLSVSTPSTQTTPTPALIEFRY